MQTNTLQIRDRLLAGLDKEYNVVNINVVKQVLSQLETHQITLEELETTRLGKHINSLRKQTTDPQLAKRAKSLVKKWRDLFGSGSKPATAAGTAQQQQQQQQQSLAKSHVTNGEPPPGGGSQKQLVNGISFANNSPKLNTVSPPVAARLAAGSRPGSSLPSSASTSPCLSRPTTPVSSMRPVPASQARSQPVSPEVNGIIPNGMPVKRSGSDSVELVDVEEIDVVGEVPASKRQRLNGFHANNKLLSQPQQKCDNSSIPAKTTPATNKAKPPPGRRRKEAVGGGTTDILKQQVQNVRRGKVRTTQELVQELTIMRAQSPGLPQRIKDENGRVTQLNETKEELMNRFFESQDGENGPSGANDVLSPPTSLGVPSPPSEPTKKTDEEKETVENVMARLPPIDAAALLAELASQVPEVESEEDDGEEIEGLIPIPKKVPEQVVVTDDMINRYNEEQTESFNGNFGHDGKFKEWHEVVSKTSMNGDLLHILPYSVID